eukprot:g162.t1
MYLPFPYTWSEEDRAMAPFSTFARFDEGGGLLGRRTDGRRPAASAAAARGVLVAEIRSCQRLLNSYSESFQWRLALELLRLLGPMGSDGLRADVMILNSVLNVCGKSQRWPEALQLLGDIFLATLKATSVTANTVFGLPTGWATALDWTRDGRRPMDVVGGISLVGRCGWREAQELIRPGQRVSV